MMAWHLETDISVTLTAMSWPLPSVISSSSARFRTCITFEVLLDILSSVMQCGISSSIYSGKSYSRTLTVVLFLSYISIGNLYLHSSHSRFFQKNVETTSPLLQIFLLISHSLRHSRWMSPMEPAHLHGEKSGLLSGSSSSPRQILHTPSRSASVCMSLLSLPAPKYCSISLSTIS